MKPTLKLMVPIAAVALLVFAVSASGAPKGNPLDAILALLTDPATGLEEIKKEVSTIEAEVTDSSHGLAEMKSEIQAIGDTLSPTSLTLSSGLFSLPANAVSVDWAVVNDAPTTQTFTVTVYTASVGPKTVVAPGPVTFTLDPGEVTHNANDVGPDKPFTIGSYYEVVVETDHPNVLPSVHVWDNTGNQVIPGTLIPPGAWVRLK